MEKCYSKCLKLIALAAALPFIYGCGAGVGVGSLLGFLFGSGGGFDGVGDIFFFGGGGDGGGLGSIHTPEPASMLLLGSGLLAMGYFKSKAGRNNK